MEIKVYEPESQIPNIEFIKLYEKVQHSIQISPKTIFFIRGLLLNDDKEDESLSQGFTLTEGISVDSQIRYLLKAEYDKYAMLFLKEVITHILPLTILYERLPADMPNLTRHLQSLGISVHMRAMNEHDTREAPCNLGHFALLEKASLTNDEISLVGILADRALKYGNAHAALLFLQCMQKNHMSIKIASKLAHVYTMLGSTHLAEWYYNYWRRHGDPRNQVWANYSLAMLYLRHHPPMHQNRNYACELLNEAHELIATYAHDEQAPFDRIFNRNGYALILFRAGKVKEAISELQRGIDYLLSKPSEKALMHASVLVYNLYQCFDQISDISSAERALARLIALDPNHVEYKIMLGEFYIKQERFSDAQGVFDGILHHSLLYPEIVNSLILCRLQEEQNIDAALKLFWQSVPKEHNILYLLDILSEYASREIIRDNFNVLNRYVEHKNFSNRFYEDLAIYHADHLLQSEGKIAAMHFLADNRKWDSGLITENLVALEAIA